MIEGKDETIICGIDTTTNKPDSASVTNKALHVRQITSTSGVAVTTSDSTTVDFSSIYVGGAGNLAVMLYDDVAAITLLAVPAGTLLAGLRIKHVMTTNTTATSIVGFA